MASIRVIIPGFGENEKETPIVILGPNGSGKTQLAQKIAQLNKVSIISAQRRTWVDDNLPVQEGEQLLQNIRSQIDQWKQNSWQPTQEINFVLSRLVQDHTNVLTKRNEEAIILHKSLDPVTDTQLIQLQMLWSRLFPKRKLEIGGFFPKVRRLDLSTDTPAYLLRHMSDGERTILYMASRVLTTEHSIILVDEPELHMHSRLSIQFWDEAEKLRSDCRFIYITHDLNFSLSRRHATVLVAHDSNSTEINIDEQIPSSVASEVLGAATLPFYAKRIFVYEGEAGKGFASEFFSVWFDNQETFAIPCGGRDSVCATVCGLNTIGIVAAEVTGLVDRDFYSEEVNNAITKGVTVLPLHEIESILCDQNSVRCFAEHFRLNSDTVWENFLSTLREEYKGQTLNGLIARRVRARVGDLLDGAFKGAKVSQNLEETIQNHSKHLDSLDLNKKTITMFSEEAERVNNALIAGGKDMLVILPGKHILDILARVLGLNKSSDLTGLVIRSLDRRLNNSNGSVNTLGEKLEIAFLEYLPKR